MPQYTADEFNELFSKAPLPNLAPPGPVPWITGNSNTDGSIRSIAEDRGYRQRPLPASGLGAADGYSMQPEAAAAWEALQAEALAAGHRLSIVSAFRDIDRQRSLFLSKLGGYSYSAIDGRLRYSAPPGYSKHHTGYALDITSAGATLGGFVNTPAFAWLSANNYENAKRFGWIPSYPFGATAQGPVPEPWEYTYVGVETIRCGWLIVGREPDGGDDLVDCLDHPATRAQAAHFLSRLFREPEVVGSPFADTAGAIHEDDSARLAGAGVLGGCQVESPESCPDAALSREQLAVFVAQALGLVPSEAAGPPDVASGNGPLIDAIVSGGLMVLCDASSGLFCPEATVSRRSLATTLERVRIQLDARIRSDFTDVAEPFAEAIRWAAMSDLTFGCNPPIGDRYCPAKPVTRGEMAVFLDRWLNLPDPPSGTTFTDDTGHFAEASIAAIVAAGISRGIGDGKFGPDQSVTRGQMALFLTRALDLPAPPGANSFSDDDGHFAEEAIESLVAAGITQGSNRGSFGPNEPLTREHMAAFLYRGDQWMVANP